MVRLLLATTLALLCAAEPLRAQGIASPGPLSAAHAKLDGLTRCLECHEAGHALSGRKCLACHVSLNQRVNAGEGFHAVLARRSPAPSCVACHREHNGRPFQLERWDGGDRARFDHTQTGWTLDGAHQRVACTDCHRAGLIADAAVRGDSSVSLQRTFLGLGTSCTSCHLEEHRGRTSRRCTDCHTTAAWKPAAGFDHDRTGFSLQGRHRELRCAQCHLERQEIATGPGGAADSSFVDFRTARPTAGGCTGCHVSPHRDRARFGRCEACHTVDGWFSLPDSLRGNFAHAQTGFPLSGAHVTAPCETCHLSSAQARPEGGVPLILANFQRPLARQPMRFARCDDCHINPHTGEISPQRGDCIACHDESRFTPTRYGPGMHDSTGFPLTGAHAAVPCTSCHRPQEGAAAGSGRLRFRVEAGTCTACHRDPHGGQFAVRACGNCHTTEAWTSLTFNHDATRYPLRGAHRRAACTRCHVREGGERTPLRFRGLPLTCGAGGCHANPHGSQFAGRAAGAACTTCHGDDEERWSPAAAFDHSRDTDFPLDRAHARAPCSACHKPSSDGIVVYRPLPRRCEDCHR